MVELNAYLDKLPVPEGVTAMKLSWKKLVNVLDDGVLLQWKLDFKSNVLTQALPPLKSFLTRVYT
eukprot:7802372-Ditylum_brightwellii.AAC.1